MAFRVHITGASGSGTSTLGAALAERLGVPRIESDDVFWLPTDPPYHSQRDRASRLKLLQDLTAGEAWVLSGSVSNWGDAVIPRFGLVVFLAASTEIRLARLRQRELERFGAAALAPGGVLHQNHADFIVYASKYDAGGPEIRSRVLHEAWLAALPCPVLRLDGLMPTAEQVERVVEALGARTT